MAKQTIAAPIDRPLSRAYLRKFTGWSTAYPRFARNWARLLNPQPSRAHGPPWGTTIVGNARAGTPLGVVRNAGISRPSDER